MTRVAVTGANGYVGSALVGAFADRGDEVIHMGRRASGEGGAFLPFSLETGCDVDRLRGVDVLVHAAWDMSASQREQSQRVNVSGSGRLFENARAAGVKRLIFISTMSAFDGCRSVYGQTKLAAEQLAIAAGAAVVRPGMVFGPKPGGMLGALTRAAGVFPIVPAPAARRRVLYLVHKDDLSALVCRLADRHHVPDVAMTAASPTPWSLAEILHVAGAARGRSPFVLSIPWWPLWVALRAAEAIGARPPFRSDSLVSLIHQDPSPSFAMPTGVDLTWRDFSAGVLQVAA